MLRLSDKAIRVASKRWLEETLKKLHIALDHYCVFTVYFDYISHIALEFLLFIF